MYTIRVLGHILPPYAMGIIFRKIQVGYWLIKKIVYLNRLEDGGYVWRNARSRWVG